MRREKRDFFGILKSKFQYMYIVMYIFVKGENHQPISLLHDLRNQLPHSLLKTPQPEIQPQIEFFEKLRSKNPPTTPNPFQFLFPSSFSLPLPLSFADRGGQKWWPAGQGRRPAGGAKEDEGVPKSFFFLQIIYGMSLDLLVY